MKESPKKKIILVLALVPVLAIAYSVFVLYPLFSKVKSNYLEVISQEEKKRQLEKEQESLEKNRALYESKVEGMEKMDNILIDPDVPVDFISFLEETASASGLSIETVPMMYSKNEEENFWPSFSFQVIIQGSTKECLRFVDKLESGPYLVEISSLSVSKKMDKESVQAAILVRAFTK